MSDFSRRTILRGSLAGLATLLPLPFLDKWVDGNGTAIAATGAPLPVRFGTWFWGLGLVAHRWKPTATGANFELTEDLAVFAPYRDSLNVLSGFGLPLDGASNAPHSTGITGIRTGSAAVEGSGAPSFDVRIADQISRDARFGSIEIACNGNPATSYSARSAATPNPSEVDPVALYERLFGAGFADPNATDFKPDINIVLEKSMLSSLTEQRKALMQAVGAGDKARLDQYFTSLRQVENQLAVQLQKPAPAEACSKPERPASMEPSTLLDDVVKKHKVMADLLALGLACNQTRVFNIALTEASSTVRSADNPTGYHQMTHEEPNDPALGYQRECAKFVGRNIAAIGDLLKALSGIKEGDGTLLDRSLVFAHSDVSDAKTHDIVGIPMMTVGKAGGRIRTGFHINGNGEPVSRVGLTMQQLMGVQTGSWGSKSMETSRPITELMA